MSAPRLLGQSQSYTSTSMVASDLLEITACVSYTRCRDGIGVLKAVSSLLAPVKSEAVLGRYIERHIEIAMYYLFIRLIRRVCRGLA
jgi:hypothetical protein